MTTTGGGSRHTCGIAALRTQTSTCCLAVDARLRMPYPAADDYWRRQAPYVPQTIIGGRSRHTCGIAALRTQTSTCCLAVDARRRMPYLPPYTTTGGGSRPTGRRRSLEAAVYLSAASPWMRGGGCITCRLDDNWRRQAPYVPQTIIGGRSRNTCGIAALRTQTSTCCLAVDARRRMLYLLPP